MEKIVFANSWQKFFTEIGMTSFGDFFDYPSLTWNSKKKTRQVYPLTFGKNENQKQFFLKRFRNPSPIEIISPWFNFGRHMSQGHVEWENAHLLLKHNIGTYQPVCFGEHIRFGLVQKSFILTEKLAAMEFTDFLAQKWAGMEVNQKRKIVISIAKLIRRIHSLNISMPDLYVWHFFINEDCAENQCQLSIIDLHRIRKNVGNQNEKITNLGRLFWNMSPKYFDNNDKDLFIEEYLGSNQLKIKANLASKIQKTVEKIARRRNLKNY